MNVLLGMFRNLQIPKYGVSVGLLLLATWLRVPLLFSGGIHGDEALFGTWANWIASGWNILLQGQVVDKPPVLFYLQAVALQLFNRADFALRVPNYVASLGLIALVLKTPTPNPSPKGRGGQESSTSNSLSFLQRQASILFALLLTFSPFMIQFSGTGFTDPLMLTLGVSGLIAAQRNRFGWSGVLLGLSIATKYTALFLLPLLPLFLDTKNNLSFPRRRESILFTQGFVGVLICMGVWLFVSGNGLVGTGDGLLIGGLRVVRSAELLPRLQTWNTHLHATFGYPFFAIVLPAALFLHWRGTQRDRYLIATATFYFAFHWLIATALYDRYMLPLVWMTCWIVARSVTLLIGWAFREIPFPKHAIYNKSLSFPRRACPREGVGRESILLAVAAVILMPNALSARAEGYTADRTNFTRIGQAFTESPYGTVVYDHFYSWQLRYELFYERAYVEWVPHPDALIENLAVFYDESRYIVLPDTSIATRFHVALNENGYTLQTLVQSDDVTLYKILKVAGR